MLWLYMLQFYARHDADWTFEAACLLVGECLAVIYGPSAPAERVYAPLVYLPRVLGISTGLQMDAAAPVAVVKRCRHDPFLWQIYCVLLHLQATKKSSMQVRSFGSGIFALFFFLSLVVRSLLIVWPSQQWDQIFEIYEAAIYALSSVSALRRIWLSYLLHAREKHLARMFLLTVCASGGFQPVDGALPVFLSSRDAC